MSRRWAVLVAVLVLLGIPLILVAVEAAIFERANRSNGTLTSSGASREYLLYVPATYDRATPTPLVISLHGAGGWPAAQMDTSQWNALADEEGFVVVYPAGITGRGPRVWRPDPADIRFIGDLIDHLSAAYNIDRRRVYANGLSNGGGMSFVLSCAMPDRIAAVGLVAAAQLLPWEWCETEQPVPMISFHGTDDALTPYDGGQTFVAPRPFPSQPVWADNWARRNQCASPAADVRVAPDVTRRSYTKCAKDADVVFYTIEGGGHTWPGGGHLPEWGTGRTTRSVEATRLMWEFFRGHPLQ